MPDADLAAAPEETILSEKEFDLVIFEGRSPSPVHQLV